MKFYKVIFNISFFCALLSRPIVSYRCSSKNIGNQLFVYCVAKIISEELEFEFLSRGIKGFPATYSRADIKNSKRYKYDFIEEPTNVLFDIQSIIKKQHERNINLSGYFQNYKIYQPYKYKIRNWLKIKNNYIQDSDDLVIHLRIESNGLHHVPFEYFEKCLSSCSYKKLYLCTNRPEEKFVKFFSRYNPIIRLHKNPYDTDSTLDDFKFIMSFKKIILTPSTFGWWAAFLSNAKEIYFPRMKRGFFSREAPNIDLFVYDEDRYIYIDC